MHTSDRIKLVEEALNDAAMKLSKNITEFYSEIFALQHTLRRIASDIIKSEEI